ncbi:MAG TPA: hypothetical protein VH540_13615 [Ktedonobacterales bacterium]
MTACSTAQVDQQRSSDLPENDTATAPATVIIRQELMRIPFTSARLMCGSTLVTDATVSAVGQGHWNNSSNAQPSTVDPDAIQRQGYVIYTPIHLSRMVVYVDHRTQKAGELVLYGGRAGQYEYDTDFPQVTPGQRYLLVLIPGSDQQTLYYTEKWLIVTDAFPIDAQGIVTLQQESIEQGVVYPAKTAPLSQIAQQLAACK